MCQAIICKIEPDRRLLILLRLCFKNNVEVLNAICMNLTVLFGFQFVLDCIQNIKSRTLMGSKKNKNYQNFLNKSYAKIQLGDEQPR